jgi:hypothetical protein
VAIKVDRKTLILARLFSIGFGIALAAALYDGAFHYSSIGNEKGFTVSSNPIKYWLSICWYAAIFSISTYFGFIAKNESE